MTTITPAIDNELQNLRDAAHSGRLGASLVQFVLISIDNIYSAPGNFQDEAEMRSYLKTLNYLISLHVYQR